MRRGEALLRLQAATAVRVALRLLIPAVALAVLAIGLQQDPARAIERVASALAGPEASVTAWIVVAVAAFAIASWADPAVAAVEHGWIAHLPATRRQRRLARWGGAWLVQAPLLLSVSLLVAIEAASSGPEALLWLPACPAIALACAIALGLRPHRRTVASPPRPSGSGFASLAFRRTVGERIVDAWIAGAVPLAAATLFLRNNTLDAPAIRLGATLGGGLSAATILALSGLALRRRRPQWAWARSLPVGSRRRVREDAVHLGLSTLPAVIGTALLDPASGVLVLAVIPWLALRTATAVRAAVPDETAMTVLFGEGAAVSALLALMPWSVLPALAGAPFALRVAARRDRELKR